MDETAADTPPAGRDNAVAIQRPFIVGLLYLLDIFLGFSVIVGVILAYLWRNEPETQAWEKTHYTYLIRTFWIGLGLFCAIVMLWLGIVGLDRGFGPVPGQALTIFFGVLGLLLALLSVAWFCVRSILSMMKAGRKEPMPNPETWWF